MTGVLHAELKVGDRIRIHALNAATGNPGILLIRMIGTATYFRSMNRVDAPVFRFEGPERGVAKGDEFSLVGADRRSQQFIRPGMYALGGIAAQHLPRMRLEGIAHGIMPNYDYSFEYVDASPTETWYAHRVIRVERLPIQNGTKWDVPFERLAEFCRRLPKQPSRERRRHG